MTAFKDYQQNALRSAVHRLFKRVDTLNEIEFSADEAIDLFAPKAHRKFLKETPGIADAGHILYVPDSFLVDWPRSLTDGATIKIHVDLSDIPSGARPFIPKQPSLQLDAQTEHPGLIGRINDWLAQRILNGTDFGRAIFVLEQLDARCSNAVQVRYLWPSILTLLKLSTGPSEATGMEKLVERTHDFRHPGNVPALPVELRAACRLASATITSASLLGDESPNKSPTATVRLSLQTHPTIKTGGIEFPML